MLKYFGGKELQCLQLTPETASRKKICIKKGPTWQRVKDEQICDSRIVKNRRMFLLLLDFNISVGLKFSKIKSLGRMITLKKKKKHQSVF